MSGVPELVAISSSSNTCLIRSTCICGTVTIISDLPLEDYKAWQDGGLIQKVFHYLPIATRDTMVTGFCEKCQEEIYSHAEEADEYDDYFGNEDEPAF